MSNVKVMIVGDTHANDEFISHVAQIAVEQNCEAIVQLGDFGYTMSPRMMMAVREFTNADNNPRKFYFLDGNHDNHDLRLQLEKDHGWEAPIELKYSDRMYYLPRGCTFVLGATVCMALGGAVSIDKKYRTLGVDWWDTEVISYAEAGRAINAGEKRKKQGTPVTVMFTHDAPITQTFECELVNSSYKSDDESRKHRELVTHIVDCVNPKLLLHGHYHTRYAELNYLPCVVEGIAADRDKQHNKIEHGIEDWNYLIRYF